MTSKLTSKNLKKIIDSSDGSELSLHVYSSFNLHEVNKIVVKDGRLILFTGTINNVEPMENIERLLSSRFNGDYDDEPPRRA